MAASRKAGVDCLTKTRRPLLHAITSLWQAPSVFDPETFRETAHFTDVRLLIDDCLQVDALTFRVALEEDNPHWETG